MNNSSKNKFYNIAIVVLLLILGILCISIFISKQSNDSDSINNIESENTSEESISPPDTSIEQDKTEEDKSKEEDRFKDLPLINDNRGVPVLYYHSIDPSESNEVILSPQKLKAQLQYIKDSGYTTLTMTELNDYISKHTPIPEKSIVITFDDGYKDNYTNAFPILKELDMKATIFVITSVIDDGYYLSKNEIKELSDYGIDIQSHTVKHLHLNTLSYEEQLQELKSSKETLEAITNKPVISVAYPFGDHDENTLKAAKAAGYTLGFLTDKGLAKPTSQSISLNRIYVSSAYSMDTFKERLLNTK